MGLKESTGVWGKTPLRWPLAVAGLSFFVVAGGFAISDDDTRIMLYTCVVMGATLIGAWIYALGHSRYTGESAPDPSEYRTPASRKADGQPVFDDDTPRVVDKLPDAPTNGTNGEAG